MRRNSENLISDDENHVERLPKGCCNKSCLANAFMAFLCFGLLVAGFGAISQSNWKEDLNDDLDNAVPAMCNVTSKHQIPNCAEGGRFIFSARAQVDACSYNTSIPWFQYNAEGEKCLLAKATQLPDSTGTAIPCLANCERKLWYTMESEPFPEKQRAYGISCVCASFAIAIAYCCYRKRLLLDRYCCGKGQESRVEKEDHKKTYPAYDADGSKGSRQPISMEPSAPPQLTNKQAFKPPSYDQAVLEVEPSVMV